METFISCVNAAKPFTSLVTHVIPNMYSVYGFKSIIGLFPGLSLSEQLILWVVTPHHLSRPPMNPVASTSHHHRLKIERMACSIALDILHRCNKACLSVDSGSHWMTLSCATLSDFCSTSSSSPPFQPIRSQIPIPTAHVMPSTAGAPASKPQSCMQEDSQSSEGHRSSSGSRTPSGSTSKSSSLSKSASSPNLDGQANMGGDLAAPKPDCLSRYRSLVNGLDHSLFPPDLTRVDDGQRFDTPAVEPTLNQSALLGGLCPDVRLRLQTTGIRDTPDCVSESYRAAMEHSYKVLPEARPGVPGTVETSNQRSSQPGVAGFPGVHTNPLSLQTQALLREHAGSKGYEPLRQDRCSDISSWQQKQQLESLRLQLEQMQVSTDHFLFLSEW